MHNEKEIYIGKTTDDSVKDFKVRINQHISNCKTGNFTLSCSGFIYFCGAKYFPHEPVFNLKILLRLNKSNKLET